MNEDPILVRRRLKQHKAFDLNFIIARNQENHLKMMIHEIDFVTWLVVAVKQRSHKKLEKRLFKLLPNTYFGSAIVPLFAYVPDRNAMLAGAFEYYINSAVDEASRRCLQHNMNILRIKIKMGGVSSSLENAYEHPSFDWPFLFKVPESKQMQYAERVQVTHNKLTHVRVIIVNATLKSNYYLPMMKILPR